MDKTYAELYRLAEIGLSGWGVMLCIVCLGFAGKKGKQRFAFLTEKMEDKWYWWEILLMVRKILIMMCGMFNSSTPERGWYISSMRLCGGSAPNAIETVNFY